MSRVPHIARFLRIHGRMPEINDPAPPWRFQGTHLRQQFCRACGGGGLHATLAGALSSTHNLRAAKRAL